VLKVRERPGVARQDPRFARRRRARLWLVWRRVLLAAVALGLVAGAVWLVFFSSVLSVRDAEVTGLEVLDRDTVLDVAEVPVGTPLATADLAAVEARVESLAAVRSAEVGRAWPDGVRIEVTEREAVAVVDREGEWRGLDETGVLFRSYPARPEGLPEVRMSAATSVDVLAEAGAVVDSLPAGILAQVEYLDVRSIDGISLRLTGGAVVTWGSADESADKAAVLAVLLRREARVYDVTAPGRPTVRG
jgi:cell division protein FtsQ